MNIEIGDWVTSYSSGIWRVYRILENVLQISASKETDRVSLVFSSRFLSSSYKPLFKSECCAPEFVEKLGPNELSRLKAYIAENPRQFEKFDKREPQVLNAYADVFFTRPSNKSSEEVARSFDPGRKIKASDVSELMNQLKLTYQGNPCWRVEYVSKEYECSDDQLVYAFNKVLEF
jgi:hypothetical protein